MRYAGQSGPRVHTADTSGSSSTRGMPSIPVTLPGALSVSTSPPITPRLNVTFTGFSVTLGTAGSTDTTVVLYKNGASLGSLTLSAGVTYGYVTFTNPVSLKGRTDNYSIGVTTAGTGAKDLGGEIEVN